MELRLLLIGSEILVCNFLPFSESAKAFLFRRNVILRMRGKKLRICWQVVAGIYVFCRWEWRCELSNGTPEY
ncbi:hypothetical protein D3C76_944110 [compost metagenome]